MNAASGHERHTTADDTVVGLLLAAGEGKRLGRPKAMVRGVGGETWLARSSRALLDGGVRSVYVVLGADIEAARHEVPDCCVIVEAADWAEGMGASLRSGLHAVSLTPDRIRAALVMLVDTPGVGPEVVSRLVVLASSTVLARASYHGQPGHPVLVGRDHWVPMREQAHGDEGGRGYLRMQDVELVECADIGSGEDVDTPDQLHGIPAPRHSPEN
jgi:CTP:molybdopterin cytidylyltransferase MocA